MGRHLLLTTISTLLTLGLTAAAAAQDLAAVQRAIPAPPAERVSGRTADDRPLRLSATRIAAGAAVTVDGRLDEPVWADAQVAEGFTQLRPDPGEPASQRTEARVVFDGEAVYVGIRLHDTAPDSVVAQLARRDEKVFSDWAIVGLDSYHDRRTAFVFGVNPAGVRVDWIIYNDTQEDPSWDAVWEAAAERDEGGWTAEMRIPLSQLRFSTGEDGEDGGAGQIWGVNFQRTIARHNEESLWAPLSPDVDRIVSRFGELSGLDGIEAPGRLELQPYTVASVTRAPTDADDPFYRRNDPGAAVGADLKYGVTSDLTLTATINPDFGQVEADPSVVNLSAFETFFPEQRPFFVEGSNIFDFGIGMGDDNNERLFYSRRIGRAPQGEAPGDYVDAPAATTILGAAKLSGKTASGWSVGALSALTGQETARYMESDAELETPVEPLTHYGVIRAGRDFREGQSAIGAIVTAANRRIDDQDALGFLNTGAYAAGVDARHRFGPDGNYTVTGQVVGSHITGSPEAIEEAQRSSARYFQRPDADHTELDTARTSLSGMAAKVELGKFSGGNWRWGTFGSIRTPGFEINDLGFQRSADEMVHAGFVGYRSYEPGPVLRRWSMNLNGWHGYTTAGERISTGGNINWNFQLLSYWGGYGGINRQLSTLSTVALRGGPALRMPAGTNMWFGFNSDDRKAVRFGFGGQVFMQDGTEGRSIAFWPGVRFRPSARMNIQLNPEVRWNTDALQYVGERAVDGRRTYLLGTVDQTTVSLTARLNYTFTPDLSLQLYAQPFVSAGDYTDYKTVADPRATRFADRVHTLDDAQVLELGDDVLGADLDRDGTADFEFDRPSFNIKRLQTNLVLRWEYMPGSTLFVVWSQGRSDVIDDGRFRFGQDVGDIFEAPGTNTLLVKLSYWMGV